MKYLKSLILFVTIALSPLALAVPGTFSVTPTVLSEDQTGGAPDGYRLYQGCDLVAGTTGALIADNVVPGTTYQFTGDSADSPVVCAVAYNAGGEGGFSNTVTLNASQNAPGLGTINLTCSFISDTGEIYNCSGVVAP